MKKQGELWNSRLSIVPDEAASASGSVSIIAFGKIEDGNFLEIIEILCERSVKISHTINPANRISCKYILLSATVLAQSFMTADAYALL